ncbi:oligosaccharide flippase family protein [Planctomicrobium sp. SH664]|uniref:oligosaccharide flippase family protein n=1 Tax=Planctomicrobium sp. SH664 TaxID=3448125 RepID=UPI003F5B665F
MSVRRNIIAGWLGHLVTVLIGFFLMPYILGTVGEAQYGAWLFINAVAAYSGMVYAGFGATICRYVADLAARKEWNKLNTVVSTIQAIYFGTASIVLAFAAGFAWLAPALKQWDGVSVSEVQVSILLIGVSIALGMICSVYGGVLVGMQRFDIKRGIEVGINVLRLVLTLVCLTQRFPLITLSLIFLSAVVLEHGLSAFFAYRSVRTLSVAPWHASREVMQECFGFSAYNAVALVAEYLIYFSDTVILGVMLGPKFVVPYQIALRVSQMIQMPIAQIGEAILPKAGELYAQRSTTALSQLVYKGMGVAFLLAGGFFIGASYFGDLLIRTWIRQEFDSTIAIMAILLGAQTVNLPMTIIRKALIGIGQVRQQAFIDLAEALVNIVLSILFIRWWGTIGVAWGTFIPLTVIELFILLPYAARPLGLTTGALWQKVVMPQVPALLALLCFCEVADGFVPAEGWIPLLTVTGGGAAALLGTWALTRRLEQHWSSRKEAAALQANCLSS